MWCALSSKGNIYATWYRGCSQSFISWKRNIKAINKVGKIQKFELKEIRQ